MAQGRRIRQQQMQVMPEIKVIVLLDLKILSQSYSYRPMFDLQNVFQMDTYNTLHFPLV